MKRLGSPSAWLVCAFILLRASSALAETPVSLRNDLSSGSVITLGDLFDDAGPVSPIAVGNGAPVGLNAVLDAGAVQRIAHLNGLFWDNPNGIRRIIVRGSAVASGSNSAATPPAKRIEVLTYSRNLMAGDLVRPEDLTFTELPAFAAPQDAPREANEIIGKIARMPLKSGAAASVHDVSNAQVIKRDDLIEVSYHADGISLVLQGKAINAAAVGDTVSVMNVSSKKIIQAVAVGPDEAVVGPEAEEIKAAGLPNPALFADNR